MLFQKKKTITVYVIQEDWAVRYDGGSDISLHNSKRAAKRHLRSLIKNESKEGIIHDFRQCDGYVEDRSNMSYEIYEAGDFTENHYTIRIIEKELRLAV